MSHTPRAARMPARATGDAGQDRHGRSARHRFDRAARLETSYASRAPGVAALAGSLILSVNRSRERSAVVSCSLARDDLRVTKRAATVSPR